MRWSERRTAVRSGLQSLVRLNSERRALSSAVAHLVLVRSMPTLRLILLYALAYVCTFAWLWRFVIEAMTGRRGERLWPPLEFSARYAALVILRVIYCFIGVGVAVVAVLLIMTLSLPRH